MKFVLLSLVLVSQQSGNVELNDQNVEKWRDFILPKPSECKWKEIEWRPIFGEGLREATEQDRPMLIWAMNGHPLGCT